MTNRGASCSLRLQDGTESELADPDQFAGYEEQDGGLRRALLCNNGLHIEIQIDRSHPIGQAHDAGVKDVILEAAITTIEDCEDSVSAVDAEDKTRVYRNWTGLMKGTLETTFSKGGKMLARKPQCGPHLYRSTGADADAARDAV